VRQRIAAFVVVAGGRLHFLRKRGEDDIRAEEVVTVWTVRGEKVS
jgi:hypothetical protein